MFKVCCCSSPDYFAASKLWALHCSEDARPGQIAPALEKGGNGVQDVAHQGQPVPEPAR